MNIEELTKAQSLFDESCRIEREAERHLKRFFIDNVGVDKPLEFTDEEFTVETTENGGDYDYVRAIKIVKVWESQTFDYPEDVYEFEFLWGFENVSKGYWKRLDNYSWDLGELINAIPDDFEAEPDIIEI